MGCTVTKAKQGEEKKRKKEEEAHIHVAVMKINLTPEIVGQNNLTLTCIDGPSVNLLQPNKSINMPALAMIPTLDLFPGLSLGM